MLVLEVFRYLKRRADKRPVGLSNFVSMESHHGQRSVEPKVSIIIPTRDKYELLRACIDSIQARTTYGNFEIVVINNASSEASTIEYLKLLRSTGIKVLDYPYAFNYSKISNFGADNSESDYLCFLNNDTEVIEPNWLGQLIDHAVQPHVGVVGSKLLYSNGTIQHIGVALGYTGAAGHAFSGLDPESSKVSSFVNSCFEVSAVTFACAIVSREKYRVLGGLDEQFGVGLGDIDFCIRSSNSGFKNLVCCSSNLSHHESKTRGPISTFPSITKAVREVMYFLKKRNIERDVFFSQKA